jgi:hypothetical protein
MFDHGRTVAMILAGCLGLAGPGVASPVLAKESMTHGDGRVAAADTIVACAPSRMSATPSDTVTLNVYVDPPPGASSRTTTTWRVTGGRVLDRALGDSANGSTVHWLLSDAGVGRFTAEARVARGGAVVGTCSVSVVLTPPTDNMGSLPSAGVFLANGAREADGYGAYSYLLFGAPPSAERKARYRAAIARVLAVAQDIASYDGQLPHARLSVNYLPVDAPLSWAKAGKDTTFADSVLAHYQYATAQTLLGWFDGPHLDGPYLVTVPAPLSANKPLKEQMIFQDLSRVTSDQLVPAWVDAFLAQSKQQQWGDPTAWQRFPLALRTAIGSVALGIPSVKAAMKDWAGWLESWSSVAKGADVK